MNKQEEEDQKEENYKEILNVHSMDVERNI